MLTENTLTVEAKGVGQEAVAGCSRPGVHSAPPAPPPGTAVGYGKEGPPVGMAPIGGAGQTSSCVPTPGTDGPSCCS